MKVRWLAPGEVLEHVNPVLAARGWAELNLDTCRVLAAFDEEKGHIVEFFVLQLFPLLGPLLRTDNEKRDAGETTRELVKQMEEYLEAEQARGYLAIADSPVTVRLCERFGMTKMESPVYGFVRVPSNAEVV